MWALLIATLPTQPNAVRLRLWRAVKALGCGALRDGAWLLPLDHAGALEALAEQVREHGGSASVLELSPRSPAQRDELLALFDRSEAYAVWAEAQRAVLGQLPQLQETEARRRLREAADALAALRRIDYYPGAAALQAEADLAALRTAVDQRFSADEPRHRSTAALPRLDARSFQGKQWATRARPWVDRLACVWFIRRFIDAKARFVWLTDVKKPPRNVIGFDYDGARFTHLGPRVSFEVMVASFGLQDDLRLQHIGAAVHYLDVGDIPVPEAAGLETILGGLRELHADDDTLCAAAMHVFDGLYASANERNT
jgi:hypothetical protein